MKRNTKDLISQTRKDVFSISIIIALIGAVLGKITIWHHITTVDNDIDYRELLSVLIGVLTTIVVTTYSLTIVALQLASVQFSPRILRWFFTEDRFNQVVLGLFIGEISYLILLKTWSPKSLDFPMISGLVIAILLICIVFPLFIAHIADSINAGGIIRRIAFNLLDEIDFLYGKPIENNDFSIPQKSSSEEKRPLAKLYACSNGYIEKVDYQGFNTIFEQVKRLASAQKINITELHQIALVGEFVSEDQPLFSFICDSENEEEIAQLEKNINKDSAIRKQLLTIIKIGKFRNYHQDINFGIRQLVDIAIKAISPAVNDPTTCINVLHYLGVVLRRMVQCPPNSLAVQALPVHIHAKEFGFREYVDHAFDQIYHFGQGDFIIVSRVLRTLNSVIVVTKNSYYLEVLNLEFQDIKNDVLNLKDSFTNEAWKKINKEIMHCEEALAQKKFNA